jgi:hypothetical protein
MAVGSSGDWKSIWDKPVLREIRYYMGQGFPGPFQTVGVVLRIIIILTLLVVPLLAIIKIVDILTAIYGLVFLVTVVFILLEIRAAPTKANQNALAAARASLITGSQTIINDFRDRFLKSNPKTAEEIEAALKENYNQTIEKLMESMGGGHRPLWTFVEVVIVLFLVACLVIAAAFLFLYAKYNAEKTGIIRAHYQEKSIGLGPVGDTGQLVPPDPAPVTKDDKERMLSQQRCLLNRRPPEGLPCQKV